MDIPPGVRVVEATGNPFTDTAAVMPGAAGTVVRTAADVVRRTSDAVSATRSFLDDLRGRSWRLADALSDAVFERSGDDLRDGLYVALDPWASNLFDLTALDSPEG